MPCFNSQQYVSYSIDSVLSQSFTQWELIIINDCSSDNSVDIINGYARQDERIKLISNDSNRGAAFSRNAGILKSKGKYIAFLDSDDLWEKTKLQKQFEMMEKHNLFLSYTGQLFVDGNGNHIGSKYIPPSKTNYKKMLYSNIMGCSTVMALSEIMKKHLFRESVFHEDYVCWLSILKCSKEAMGLKEALTSYRIMRGSKSANKLISAKGVYQIYRRVLKFNIFVVWYYMFFYIINGLLKTLAKKF